MEVVEISPKYFILNPEGDLAKFIASKLTWFSAAFSPKDVPRFYDISAVTENPELFRAVVQSMSARYRAMGDKAPTHILGFDARGFLLGAPIAYELGIPFVMMRKAEKSPGVLLRSEPYHKEYAEAHPDTMAIRQGSIGPGSRVVLVDDLIATGGTAISGFQLVEASGATVVEFAAVIGIPFLDGVAKIHSEGNGKFKDVPVFTLVHDSAITDATCGDPTAWENGKSRIIPYSVAIQQRQ